MRCLQDKLKFHRVMIRYEKTLAYHSNVWATIFFLHWFNLRENTSDISNNFTFLSFQTGRIESALNHTNELLREGMVLWLRTLIKLNPDTCFLPPHRSFGANSWHAKRYSFPSPNRYFQGTAWNHYKPKGAFTARSLVSVVTGGSFASMWVFFP